MHWKIGQLARQAGVNIQTLRYYERSGLLQAQSRSETGYRYYNQESLKRLNFIIKAKELGFSLKEINELLDLRSTPRQSCHQVRERAEEKRKEVQTKISFLKKLDQSLSVLIVECETNKNNDSCPILSNLETDVII